MEKFPAGDARKAATDELKLRVVTFAREPGECNIVKSLLELNIQVLDRQWCTDWMRRDRQIESMLQVHATATSTPKAGNFVRICLYSQVNHLFT